jgi:5-formyltetrahydrofolate cyclo-ligase
MRRELDVFPILAMLSLRGKTLALPKLTAENSPLEFRIWQPGDPLVLHALGMKEPVPETAAIVPALILVPLLAFDNAGYRLGYGGGYYDRTVATLRVHEIPPLIIGVAYGFQEVSALPAEAHDTKLDGILTELGVSMFGNR